MPQVLSTMPQSTQSGYYRPQQNYQPYMGGMSSMGNMGMQGLQNPMQQMQAMNSMQAMQGMAMGTARNNPMGMMPNMSYQKYNDFYDPVASFSNRFQNDNKMNSGFGSQGRQNS